MTLCIGINQAGETMGKIQSSMGEFTLFLFSNGKLSDVLTSKDFHSLLSVLRSKQVVIRFA